jgi:hypothetical protein
MACSDSRNFLVAVLNPFSTASTLNGHELTAVQKSPWPAAMQVLF